MQLQQGARSHPVEFGLSLPRLLSVPRLIEMHGHIATHLPTTATADKVFESGSIAADSSWSYVAAKSGVILTAAPFTQP
jgi:hypothetical protein